MENSRASKAGLMGMKGLLVALLIGTAAVQTKAADPVVIHVKNPWPTMVVWEGMKVTGGVIAGPPGAAMQDDGDGWYSYTLAGSIPFNATFSFALYSPAAWDATGKSPDYASKRGIYLSGAVMSGGAGTEFNAQGIRDYGGDVWIIPGLTGAPVITIVPQAKKVVMLFNPWPANGPMGKVGNSTTFQNLLQSQDPNRCGWYGAYFNAAPFTVAFKSIFGSETYGTGGLGDSKAIDLTSFFATSDTVYIYGGSPGVPPTISTTPSAQKGTCSFNLAVTVRDFSKAHPDFDDPALDHHDNATLGMVLPNLDAEGKPVASTKTLLQSQFHDWFRDKTTGAAELQNKTYCRDIPMKKSTKGLWGYDSFKDSPSLSFFPIDRDPPDPEDGPSEYWDAVNSKLYKDPTGKKHNFNFCMEMHATFKYQKGQEFSFMGDDDTWAFINKKLALDIGGPHPAVAGTIKLDTLGLKDGDDYPFDFFFCERQPTGSDLAVQTSIFFEQQQSTFFKKIDLGGGAFRYEIWEITQGDKSCSSAKGGDTALAVADFKLTGPSVPTPEVLSVGTVYGGVTLLPTKDQVTIDTSKVTGLRGGVYTITFTTKSGFGTIKFTVPGKNEIQFTNHDAINQVTGTSVEVGIQATYAGVADNRAEKFTLVPKAGLKVYLDAALTVPVVDGTLLTTVAATGKFTVYVTSTIEGTYSLGLLLDPEKVKPIDTRNFTFYKQPQVEKPVASPPGQVFSVPLSVTLKSPTVGADIFYTTDGTEPDTVVKGSTLKFTTAIPITATTKIKAIAVKATWINSDVMTEQYTYVVPKAEKPVAAPAGQIFILPLAVTLTTTTPGADIFYTTDGTEPDTVVKGSTLKFTTAIPVAATTKIKAIAFKAGWIKSDVMTEDYIYLQPLAVKKAFYQDLNGDGRIETVVLDFEKDIPNTPDKLSFKIVDATGKSNDKTAAKAEIAYAPGSKSRVLVTLAVPFDYGVTSVGNPTVSGQIFKQDNIPSLEAGFPVDDSVPPVPIKAMVMEPDSSQLLKRILITVSESVNLPLTSQSALIFKREGAEMASGDVKIDRIEKTGDRDYVIYVDSTSKLFPIVGDSVAINVNGEIKDLVGNSPSHKTFMRLDGTVPKAKPMDMWVTFPNGNMEKPSEGLLPQGNATFIPIDMNGTALPGGPGEGKCAADCFAGDNVNFVGPVFHIITPGPVTYEFHIFNNHGEFVAVGKGAVTDADLSKLVKKNDASGVKYEARIVWTGRTEKGSKAATGAYVLQTAMTGSKDTKSGAAPGKSTKRVLFGLLRNFTGS